MDMEAWRATIHGVAKSRTWLSDWTELSWTLTISLIFQFVIWSYWWVGFLWVFKNFFKYLFYVLIWLGHVLFEACWILDLPCFIQGFYLGHGKSGLPHAGSSSLTRDPTQAPCCGSMESWPLDHQGVWRGRVSICEFGEHTHIQPVTW